jgi:ArsR family transcriptional regulator, arsenate/arsenite/antimonite-responsive transcriptional repressor / arsenate reductase (thioredoxin)
MNVQERSMIHAALGDRYRLGIVDELRLSDRTFQELAGAVGLPGNAAAHHLAVLEAAGLIERRVSEGDRRRRYVTLRQERLDDLLPAPTIEPATVLFVCTHNSARSQFAAALWHERTGRAAESAGTQPAERVHPKAVNEAATFGIDLRDAVPRGYDAVTAPPGLVVSVCDRAREAGLPFAAPAVHWSIPDPVLAGTPEAFRAAFAELETRVDRLTASEPRPAA